MQHESHPQSPSSLRITRRAAVAGGLATAASVMSSPATFAAEPVNRQPTICAFIKFVQSLSYEDMAAAIAEIGFDGVESTVRNRGHVLPERVEDDLPRQVEALRNNGIEVTIMTTDVVGVDQPLTERVLRTGAKLGIKAYRMGYYRYQRGQNLMQQLDDIRPRIRDLAALNRELGITGLYQNHSGANLVGAPVWDLHHLIRDIPKEHIGTAFDIRHATVEGGLAWPLHYELMQPHIGAVYVKDFDWQGGKAKNVPLGKGHVSRRFFEMHRASGIDCPYSLHVEYLGHAGAAENLAALKRDLKTLKTWISS